MHAQHKFPSHWYIYNFYFYLNCAIIHENPLIPFLQVFKQEDDCINPTQLNKGGLFRLCLHVNIANKSRVRGWMDALNSLAFTPNPFECKAFSRGFENIVH